MASAVKRAGIRSALIPQGLSRSPRHIHRRGKPQILICICGRIGQHGGKIVRALDEHRACLVRLQRCLCLPRRQGLRRIGRRLALLRCLCWLYINACPRRFSRLRLRCRRLCLIFALRQRQERRLQRCQQHAQRQTPGCAPVSFAFHVSPPFPAFPIRKAPFGPGYMEQTTHFGIRKRADHPFDDTKSTPSPLPRTRLTRYGRSPDSCFALKSAFSGKLSCPMAVAFL